MIKWYHDLANLQNTCLMAQRHIIPNFDYNIIIKLIFVCLLFDST